MKCKVALRIIIYIVTALILVLWLSIGSSIKHIDYKIVTANMFSFVINNIFLYYQYHDINTYYSIYDYSIIRINRNKYFVLIIKTVFYNTLMVMAFGYIIPIIIFSSTIYNLSYYVIYLAILCLLFLSYDVMILLSFNLKNNFLKILMRVIPFVLNIVIQINFFQFLYTNLGGGL